METRVSESKFLKVLLESKEMKQLQNIHNPINTKAKRYFLVCRILLHLVIDIRILSLVFSKMEEENKR